MIQLFVEGVKAGVKVTGFLCELALVIAALTIGVSIGDFVADKWKERKHESHK